MQTAALQRRAVYPSLTPYPPIQQTAGFRFTRSSRQRLGIPQYGPADLTQTIATADRAIDRSRRRFLTVGFNTPWQIFHGVLALRQDFLIREGNELVPAIDWMSSGVTHRDTPTSPPSPLVEVTPNGARFHPFSVPWAFEGHTNQFLAILSLSGLPRTHEFKTPEGRTVTMDDMVRSAQLDMTGEGELTWTLWFLSHYIEPDAEWLTAAGEPWSMERLVSIEARRSVEDAPCGGTHRLFALALARNAYLAKHKQLRGPWVEADQRVRRYVAATKQMQNSDGSLSEQWYKGPGQSSDLERRLKTSGHQLEWLMAAIPQQELSSAWVQAAVRAVAADVTRSADLEAECGALYHALDALVLYRQRTQSIVPLPGTESPSKPLLQEANAAGDARVSARPAPTAETPSAEGWTTTAPADGAETVASAGDDAEGIATTQDTVPSPATGDSSPSSDAVGTTPSIAEATPTSEPGAGNATGEMVVRPQATPEPATSEQALAATDATANPKTDTTANTKTETTTETTAPQSATLAETKPQQTKLPDGIDDEAAPRPVRVPKAAIPLQTVSDPTPSESATESADESDPQAVPGVPLEARRAQIQEASFRFSHLDADGKLVLP